MILVLSISHCVLGFQILPRLDWFRVSGKSLNQKDSRRYWKKEIMCQKSVQNDSIISGIWKYLTSVVAVPWNNRFGHICPAGSVPIQPVLPPHAESRWNSSWHEGGLESHQPHPEAARHSGQLKIAEHPPPGGGVPFGGLITEKGFRGSMYLVFRRLLVAAASETRKMPVALFMLIWSALYTVMCLNVYKYKTRLLDWNNADRDTIHRNSVEEEEFDWFFWKKNLRRNFKNVLLFHLHLFLLPLPRCEKAVNFRPCCSLL